MAFDEAGFRKAAKAAKHSDTEIEAIVARNRTPVASAAPTGPTTTAEMGPERTRHMQDVIRRGTLGYNPGDESTPVARGASPDKPNIMQELGFANRESGQDVRAFNYAAANTATLGAAPAIMDIAGVSSPQEREQIAAASPIASAIGQAVGTFGPGPEMAIQGANAAVRAGAGVAERFLPQWGARAAGAMRGAEAAPLGLEAGATFAPRIAGGASAARGIAGGTATGALSGAAINAGEAAGRGEGPSGQATAGLKGAGMGALFGGFVGAASAAGRGLSDLVRSEGSTSARKLAAVERAGGEAGPLGVRGGEFEQGALKATKGDPLAAGEVARGTPAEPGVAYRLVDDLADRYKAKNEAFGPIEKSVLAEVGDKPFDNTSILKTIEEARQGITSSRGEEYKAGVGTALDEFERYVTPKLMGDPAKVKAFENRPEYMRNVSPKQFGLELADPTVSDLVKIRRLADSKMRESVATQGATAKDVPWIAIRKAAADQIAAESPQLGATYKQHHDALTKLEQEGYYLTGEYSTINVPAEARGALYKKAAARLGREGKATEAGRQAAHELELLATSHPEYRQEIDLPSAAEGRAALSYTGNANTIYPARRILHWGPDVDAVKARLIDPAGRWLAQGDPARGGVVGTGGMGSLMEWTRRKNAEDEAKKKQGARP
jgi:hypothetical protein